MTVNKVKVMLINAKGISRTFRSGNVKTHVLKDIDLSVHDGEFVSIMGTSGCGKTTLLKILALLDDMSQGSYQLNGQEVLGMKNSTKSMLRRKDIGFIYQNFNLIDDLTVYQNIELPLIYNKISSTSRKRQIEEIAAQLGLSHRLTFYPNQLSGGQQQRVAIARAVVHNPKIIFADEPTGNLDSENGAEIMKILTDLHALGTTILMVTHAKSEASFSERTITMKDGRILSEISNRRTIDLL